VHYVVIGAGAVGGTIGGRLHQHGHRVTLVARGAHLAALRQRGLRLATPDGEHVLDVPVAADPADLRLEPDCVLVLAVKSQDSLAALGAWVDAPVRGGGVAGDRLPVLCAQNGVANERLALRLFQRVYAVCVWLPASFLEPGVVAAEGHPHPGMLHLGRYPAGADGTGRRGTTGDGPDGDDSSGGGADGDSADGAADGDSRRAGVEVGVDPTVERIAADLTASGFVTRVRADVMRWKYGKLLGNLGNGLEALLGGWDEDLYGRLRAEGVAALDAAGIPYTSREEEIAERGDRVRVRPVAGRERGGGSTWQSLVRGAGSVEVDYLNGEVVLLGRAHGVPTPANLAVQRAVRHAARAGTAPGRLPADALRALIRG
jgi:2-dehydropantoate 2-reductase